MAIRRSVAIVDDDPLVRSSLSSLGRSYGLTMTTFPSAEDFLLSDPRAADCVLSDIQMPGMSGLELQQRLADQVPDLPVVIMTALVNPSLRDQALAAGARGFLNKPFQPGEVVAILEDLLGPLEA